MIADLRSTIPDLGNMIRLVPELVKTNPDLSNLITNLGYTTAKWNTLIADLGSMIPDVRAAYCIWSVVQSLFLIRIA